MKDAIEKLKALRSKNESEIQKHGLVVVDLERKMQALSCENIGLEAAIKELSGNAGEEKTPMLQGVGKYSKMSLSDSIEDVVNKWGSAGLLTKEIITKLFAEGFKTTAKDFYSSVYAVAQRLVKVGRIAEGK